MAGIFGSSDTKTVVLKSIMQKSHWVARAGEREGEYKTHVEITRALHGAASTFVPNHWPDVILE
jgi:hypothetical protein